MSQKYNFEILQPHTNTADFGDDWIGLDSFINVTDWYKNGGCLVMKNIITTYIDTLHGIVHYQWGQQWACQSRHVMGWLVGGHNDDG